MELSHLAEIRVFMTGASLSGDWFALVGDMAQRNAVEMSVDKVFIGVDGIHPERGLTTNYPDQAAIHRVMIRQARKRIVVADHRKIGVVGTSLIAQATEFDILITDKATADEAVAPYIATNINVLRA